MFIQKVKYIKNSKKVTIYLLEFDKEKLWRGLKTMVEKIQ